MRDALAIALPALSETGFDSPLCKQATEVDGVKLQGGQKQEAAQSRAASLSYRWSNPPMVRFVVQTAIFPFSLFFAGTILNVPQAVQQHMVRLRQLQPPQEGFRHLCDKRPGVGGTCGGRNACAGCHRRVGCHVHGSAWACLSNVKRIRTLTQSREIVREFATSKSAKMGNFGSKEPWKIRAFGKCRRKRLSCQCFQ